MLKTSACETGETPSETPSHLWLTMDPFIVAIAECLKLRALVTPERHGFSRVQPAHAGARQLVPSSFATFYWACPKGVHAPPLNRRDL